MISRDKIAKEFPVISNKINGKKHVYIDSAASSQKPVSVINKLKEYNETSHANIHRGAYALSVNATRLYDETREKVKVFINARYSKEIIYTKGTTESINLVAHSYAMAHINEGDEILVGITEHHSNLVPWQHVAKIKGARLRFIRVNEFGLMSLDEIEDKITDKTKLVAVGHISNALGSIHPIKEIIKKAHEVGAVVLIDAAQSSAHEGLDVQGLDADFLVFSGHKMFGPTGIGILYGRLEILEEMEPYQFGGDMIEYVEEQGTTYAELPERFEAGTPNIEGVVGLGAAIDYINEIGMENIKAYEHGLTTYALEQLNKLDFITVYGPPIDERRGPVISFNVKAVHPHDVATILDQYGVAIRAGHHCAQPLMRYLDIYATCRASFSIYNTKEDIDVFVESLKEVRGWLGYGS